MSTTAERYDVLILGADLGASALAVVLARHGVRVAVLAEDTHPRYRYGETQTPATSGMLRTLAARYDVPELEHLAGFRNICESVSRQVGQARAQTFHTSGGSWAVRAPRAAPEAILYRQDTDAYLFWTAVRYGAHARQMIRVEAVETTPDEVVVTTTRGETFRGRCLIDASGRDSAAMASLGVPVRTGSARRATRSLHTLLVHRSGADGKAGRSDGPAHHLFADGYLTVSRFGNHPDAPNTVVGVRLTVDAERAPEGEPEQEFRTLLKQVPDAAGQLAATAAVQPWFSSGVQQYERVQTHGDRWFAFGATAGYVDPFLGESLHHELRLVGALAWRLIDAVAEGAAPRFADVACLDERLRAYAGRSDEMLLDALADPALYRTALRVRQVGEFYRVLHLSHVRRHLSRGDDKPARTLDESTAADPTPVTGYAGLMDAAVELCRDVVTGRTGGGAASADLAERLRRSGLVPPLSGFPEARGRDGGRLLSWFRRSAPAEVRSLGVDAADDLLRGRL